MNKQRKVLITITYNEMGIIIDTKAEEVAQPVAKDINVPVSDCISRQAEENLIEKREWIEGYRDRWYRKNFFCAKCGMKIRTESWDEKRCFGEGTILKDNSMPRYCPNCGTKLDGREG